MSRITKNNEKLKLEVIIKVILQFIKFGIVGISNTIVSLVVYYLLIHLKVNYIISNTIGFIVSVINAFYWNKKYVFHTENNKKNNSFIKVFISYGLTFLLNTGLLYLMVETLNISSYIAPIINILFLTPINFILNKFWAFK